MLKGVKLFSVFSVGLALLSGCKKDKTEAVVEPGYGTVEINIANMINNQLLMMNGTQYLNPHGDTFAVNKLLYYVSNVSLIKNDGSVYKVPESYFLLDESKPETKVMGLSGIPEGTYTAVHFLLGVDSARNTSGAQTGALDPGNHMFWTWSTGYIFFKLEGTSPQAVGNGGKIAFHIGGFETPHNNIRTIEVNSNQLIVKKDMTTKVYLNANVNEAFDSPTIIDFGTQPFISDAKNGGIVADNYVNMFSLDKIINP